MAFTQQTTDRKIVRLMQLSLLQQVNCFAGTIVNQVMTGQRNAAKNISGVGGYESFENRDILQWQTRGDPCQLRREQLFQIPITNAANCIQLQL